MWGLGKSAWPNWEWVDEGLKALTGFHHRVLYRPEGPYILPLRIDLLPKRPSLLLLLLCTRSRRQELSRQRTVCPRAAKPLRVRVRSDPGTIYSRLSC